LERSGREEAGFFIAGRGNFFAGQVGSGDRGL